MPVSFHEYILSIRNVRALNCRFKQLVNYVLKRPMALAICWEERPGRCLEIGGNHNVASKGIIAFCYNAVNICGRALFRRIRAAPVDSMGVCTPQVRSPFCLIAQRFGPIGMERIRRLKTCAPDGSAQAPAVDGARGW
jgi:hypothetical protein